MLERRNHNPCAQGFSNPAFAINIERYFVLVLSLTNLNIGLKNKIKKYLIKSNQTDYKKTNRTIKYRIDLK